MARRRNSNNPAAFCRAAATSALVAWVTQLAVLGCCLHRSPWKSYWLFRDLYRPGLDLYAALGRGRLPDSFFNPLDRTGVLTGLAFAALVYAAAVGVALATLLTLPRLVRRA